METGILNWTLIAVAAILLLSMAYGYRKGLIRMVFTSVLLILMKRGKPLPLQQS